MLVEYLTDKFILKNKRCTKKQYLVIMIVQI